MSAQKTKDNIFKPLTAQDLDVAVEKKPVSSKSFALCVRELLQNWRQGTVGVKDRSEVAFSNKKPWKQKGTGRARAGTRRSPLWRKGGIVFGPQPRVRKIRVPREVRQAVFNNLFFDYLNAGKIAFIDWQISGDVPKTKQAFLALNAVQLADKKINLFVAKDDSITQASFINLPNVDVIFYDEPNAFDLSNADYWVVLKKDVDSFKDMVSQWI